MATVSEQRRQLRKRVFKGAQIVVTESAHQYSSAARETFQIMALASVSLPPTVFPQQFDIIIDRERRAVRSVWRNCTEMGVMFADESRKPADFLERERDVASLIELPKMAEEKWPNPGNDEISESEMLSRDQA